MWKMNTSSFSHTLGVHLDDKLNCSANAGALYKKGQSRLFFLRKLRSFEVCKETAAQSVMANVLFYAAVCWGGNMSKRHWVAGQAGQEGGLGGGAEPGLTGDCGGETDAGQALGHHGQCQSPPPQCPGRTVQQPP